MEVPVLVVLIQIFLLFFLWSIILWVSEVVSGSLLAPPSVGEDVRQYFLLLSVSILWLTVTQVHFCSLWRGLILQICALSCLLQSPTEEIFTSLWPRDGSRIEILVWKVSLLWLKSVWTHWESRSQCCFGLFSHESSVVKGTELTYDSENMKMLQFK